MAVAQDLGPLLSGFFVQPVGSENFSGSWLRFLRIDGPPPWISSDQLQESRLLLPPGFA
jgi:hypothetical protein